MYIRCYTEDPGKTKRRGKQMNSIKRGDRIKVNADSIPQGALSNDALVLRGSLSDAQGTFHKVMFNAGEHGVIFASILDSAVKA